MKKRLLRLCSLIIVGSMAMMSLTACFNGGKKEVTELADSFAKAVCDLDVDGMEDLLSDPDEELLEVLKEELVFDDSSLYDSNETAIFSAIAETLDYEVDEDSVEVSKKDKSGSAKVSFTMVDFETTYEDGDFSDAIDFADELSSSDETISFDVKLKFVLEDDEWLVKGSSLEDAVAVYEEFVFFDFSFSPDLSTVTTSYEWFFEEETNEDGTPVYYTMSSSIDLELYFDDDSIDYSEVYFTVAHEGEEVFVSEPNDIDAWFHPDDLSWDYFLPGTYVISFFDGNHNLINSSSCIVIEHEAEVPTDCTMLWYFCNSSGENGQDAVYSEGCNQIDLDWTNCPDSSRTYYEVYYNGEHVYTSENGTFEGYFDEYNGATLVDGCLPAGEYLIVFYFDGAEACYGNAFVNMGDGPFESSYTGTTSSGTSGTIGTSARVNEMFFDEVFYSSVDTIDYYDLDGTLNYDMMVYPSGTTDIGMIVNMNSSNTYSEVYGSIYLIPSEQMETFDDSFDGPLEDLLATMTEISSGSVVPLIDNQFTLAAINSSGLQDGMYFFFLSDSPEPTEASIIFGAYLFVVDY